MVEAKEWNLTLLKKAGKWGEGPEKTAGMPVGSAE
jgi:hypothetical protein